MSTRQSSAVSCLPTVDCAQLALGDSEHLSKQRRPDAELVGRLRAALRAGPPVRLAVLFGSSVSGAVRPDSDVDIPVSIGQPDRDDSIELALGQALALAAQTEVDLIRIDKASTLLKWQIAAKGVLPNGVAALREFAGAIA